MDPPPSVEIMRISMKNTSSAKALLLVGVLMTGGCASTYRTTSEDTK